LLRRVAEGRQGDIFAFDLGATRLKFQPHPGAPVEVVELAEREPRRVVDLIAGLSSPLAPRGVAVAVCGLVDARTGLVRLAINLGWEGVELGAMLAERLGVPVVLLNDADAAALGAWQWLVEEGALDPVEGRLLCFTLGTGLGGGLVVGGRLQLDRFGSGIEPGHAPYFFRGRWVRGDLVGGAAGLDGVLAEAGLPLSARRGEELSRLAEQGDEGVLAALFQWGEALAHPVAVGICLTLPQVVVFTGGLSHLFPHIGEGLRQGLGELLPGELWEGVELMHNPDPALPLLGARRWFEQRAELSGPA